MNSMFHRWLIGDLGTAGNYDYTAIHYWTVAVVAAALFAFLLLALALRKRPKAQRGLLVSVALFHLAFEVAWRLIYLLVKKDSISCWWPTYPCNLGGILLPIIALTNCRTGKKMFYLFGLVGGVLTFAVADGIFSSDVLVFPILKSILQHTGLLLIPTLEMVGGTWRPRLKDLGWVIGGCLLHLLNCEVIDRLLGFTGDYMFFRSGMPFVIPGVPQWITLSVFALLVLALLSFLGDIKGSVAWLKGLRRKKQEKRTS